MARKAVVHGIGHAVPDKVLTNADLEKVVDTNDAWIMQRTGIKERRITTDEETTSMLATQAAKEALERSGTRGEEIDLVVCGTVTGDMLFPATSCLVQSAIGATHAGAFDVGAACAGFIYSLSVASAMVETGQVNNALVIGADTLTKRPDR